MKRLVLTCMAALAAASCDDALSEKPLPTGYLLRFTAAVDAYPTLPVDSLPGGNIGLLAVGSSGSVKGRIPELPNRWQPMNFDAQFTGKANPGDIFYAYYPDTKQQDRASTTVRLSIPSRQTQPAGGTFDLAANPIVARPIFCEENIEIGEWHFRQLGSTMAFDIFSSDPEQSRESILSVTFTADSPAAGEFDFDLTQSGAESLPAISGYTAKSITVQLAEPLIVGSSVNEATRVCMVAAPGVYNGTVTIETDREHYELPLRQDMDLRRALVREIGIDLASSKVTDREDELDTWLKEEFTAPYYMEVLYRWSDVEPYASIASMRLVPVDYGLVEPLMTALRNSWIEPFDQAANRYFLRKLGPRRLVLVDALECPPGVVRYIESEDTMLLNVRGLDPADEAILREVLRSILCELAHTLRKEFAFDKTFGDISRDYYGSGWQEFDRETAAENRYPRSWAFGFVRNAAMNSPEDDFAEMFSTICAYGKNWFDEQVCGAAEDSATNPHALADLQVKLALVESYMLDIWGIRLFDDPADPRRKGLENAIKEAIAETIKNYFAASSDPKDRASRNLPWGPAKNRGLTGK